MNEVVAPTANYTRLHATEGVFESEFFIPKNPFAWLVLPHSGNFLADPVYQQRIPTLNQLGFATFCINVQSLQDSYQATFMMDVSALSQRLLSILDAAYRQVIYQQPTMTVLCVEKDLVPAAIRVCAIRDIQIHALITHGGILANAGKKFLDALSQPLLALPEAYQGRDLVPDNTINWLATAKIESKKVNLYA